MSDDFVISFEAPQPVHDALKRIGRIEDASFSPDNRRLALACLGRNSVAIADVTMNGAAERPHVAVTGVTEYSSPHLMTPHGADFLDDETIIVANREGNVVAFRLPPNGSGGDGAALTPIDTPPGNGFELLHAPGSIAIIRAPGAPVEVLVCDNRKSTVTRHTLEDDSFGVTSNDILLRRLLDFPDSVAVTDDNHWIAISNHDAHVVLLYRRTSPLSEDSDPACLLRGTMYPHGLRFSTDGRHLLVADAGRPYVQVYRRDGEDWHGVQYPQASLRVMGDDIFALGRDDESRGPKGIAIDRQGRVLTVTYENQPLAFFDVAAMLEHADGRDPDQTLRLSYELEALEEATARREESIARLMGSTSFRVTAPLRRLNAAWSKRRR